MNVSAETTNVKRMKHNTNENKNNDIEREQKWKSEKREKSGGWVEK